MFKESTEDDYKDHYFLQGKYWYKRKGAGSDIAQESAFQKKVKKKK
jgi:hypothetical protein